MHAALRILIVLCLLVGAPFGAVNGDVESGHDCCLDNDPDTRDLAEEQPGTPTACDCHKAPCRTTHCTLGAAALIRNTPDTPVGVGDALPRARHAEGSIDYPPGAPPAPPPRAS